MDSKLALLLVPLAVACRADELAHGPEWMFPSQVRGSGVEALVEHELDDEFRRLEVDGSLDVRCTIGQPGEPRRAIVRGDDNLVGSVFFERHGDVLLVRPADGNLRPLLGLEVELIAPPLVGVALRGSGDLAVTGLAAERARVELFGAGDLTLGGRADQVDARLYGSGSLDLTALAVDELQVELTGSGDVRAGTVAHLGGAIRGSGNVRAREASSSTELTTIGSGWLYLGPPGHERPAPRRR